MKMQNGKNKYKTNYKPMNNQLILEPKKKTLKEPKRIAVKDKNDFDIAVIYCDNTIAWKKCILTESETEEILTISKNFNLFFTNLFHP